MFRQFFGPVAVSVSLALFTPQAKTEDLWSLYEPACNANGIDPDPCICILDEVVEAHGEQAARYVGLDMSMRYDEAGAILEVIGEDRAFAASSMFDVARNKDCTAGRIARLQGTYSNSGSNRASGSASASGAAAVSTGSGSEFKTVEVMTAGVPVFDLRAHGDNVICDVSVQFGKDVKPAGDTGNIRNYVGFYRIVDANGGIDENGDGIADVRPGDTDYATQVQIRAGKTRLYVSKHAGQEQYLGEIQLAGGALYAPYLRFEGAGARTSGVLSGLSFTTEDRQKTEAFLRHGMNSPQNLYFVFEAANVGGANHFVSLGDDQLGFEQSPGAGVSPRDYDDAIFDFTFGF